MLYAADSFIYMQCHQAIAKEGNGSVALLYHLIFCAARDAALVDSCWNKQTGNYSSKDNIK